MSFGASIGVAALTWVVSPIVKDLYDKGRAFLGSDIAKGLEDLETTLLPQFQLTIQATQDSPHKDKLNKWLLRLKNAYYDAEAILHEVEYEILRREVKGEQNKTGVRISSLSIIKPLAKATSKVNEKLSNLSPQKRKLLNQLNKLKDITAEAKTFHDWLKSTQTENGNNTTSGNSPPITSFILPYKVFGRDEDRDRIIKFFLGMDEKGGSSSSSAYSRSFSIVAIIKFLLGMDEKGGSSSSSAYSRSFSIVAIIKFLLGMNEKGGSSSSSAFSRSFSVVAITAIGGAGKTTLAQYVYNDERVKKHFGKRMWICLSQEMDVIELTNKMIQCITNKPSKLTELSTLQNNLMNALESEPKGVLLILDNFWPRDTKTAEEDKQWDDLLAPFNCVRANFKIIVTSRSDKFPVPLLPVEHIKLSNLEDTDFQALFRYYAGLESSGPELQTVYYTIADKIARELSKSPLAARAVGDQLHKNRDIRFWQDTLRNVNLSDTMEVLLWSYQRMDVQLQRCFLFFGSFNRGTRFTKFNLVQYWVALDFIQPSDDRISAEDVGFGYFDLMLANSLIVECVDGQYTIHDLFHELAENLSTGDCFRVTDSETVIPSTTVLHVSLRVSNENLKEKLSSISNLCNLRTLFLETLFIEDVKGTFSLISTTFKNLRVLEIWAGGYGTLPEIVGDLRNLRYLDVYRSSIKELPDSVSQLYHLQYLLLPESLETLPTTLRNLTRLRTIHMYDKRFICVNAFPPVPYLGRLTSLKSLPEFHVRREEGYELQQLGHLREIGGTLRIVGLENVRDKDEALAARLIDKVELKEIKLVWSGSGESIASEVDVIEAFRPPTNLECLTINGYRGSVCPS